MDSRLYLLPLFYLFVIIIFKFIENSLYRFLLLSILACYCLYLFKIKKNIILIYLFITLLAIIIEIIFIKFFKTTWYYYNKELFVIPYWLVSLWLCAIIFFIEIYKLSIKYL